jgi:lactate permease
MLMAGFKKSVEVMPAIIVSGVSFAFFQWFSSNYLGPMLPDVIAGLASIISLMVLLRYWKPKNVWYFQEEPEQAIDTRLQYTTGEVLRAWSPFIIMTLTVIAWGLDPVKAALNSLGSIKFMVPGLENAILKTDGSPLTIKPFDFNYLSSPGTAVLIAAIVSLPLVGMRFTEGLKTYLGTLNQLKYPFLTIASVVGFAFITNNSGMSNTMAMALASTGVMFPFFSPVLGWLGVFLTGSDTSSNALFCRLQYTSAEAIGVDPVITVSANASGGVTGKMISPQSIAIGTAAVGLVGKESELFRFTVKHSFIMLLVVCLLTVMQAYLFTWIVPAYELVLATAAATSDIARGFLYLLILAIAIAGIALTVFLLNRKKPKLPVPTAR